MTSANDRIVFYGLTPASSNVLRIMEAINQAVEETLLRGYVSNRVKLDNDDITRLGVGIPARLSESLSLMDLSKSWNNVCFFFKGDPERIGYLNGEIVIRAGKKVKS